MGEVCRKMGASGPPFYRRKKQFVGMGVPEIRWLKQLEDENSKLKRPVADLTRDRSMRAEMFSGESGEACRSTRIATLLASASSASVRRFWIPADAGVPLG